MILYHLTPARLVARILREGLAPRVGPRARRIRETVPAIYFFGSTDDLDAGLEQWLELEFDDETPLALLEVDLPAHCRWERVAFEIQVYDPIPPTAIRVISRNYGV
jgi:hypothetical protein